MKKRLLAILLCAFMLIGAVGCGSSKSSGTDKQATEENTEGSGETIELKLGHPLGPGTSQHIYLQKWADKVAEASNGKYKIIDWYQNDKAETTEKQYLDNLKASYQN